MNSDTGNSLILIACKALVEIFKFLPAKIRLVVGSLVTAFVSGTLIGFAILTATEHDFDLVLEQAKIVIPVLSIIIFLVIYFGWRHFQEQQEKQHLEARFDLARTLIEGHHYTRARTILGAINNPKARDWETKLCQRTPDDPNFLQQFQ